jgi:PBSX family phage portal protein
VEEATQTGFDVDLAVRELGDRVTLVKAQIVGRDRVATSNALESEAEEGQSLAGAGIVPPPYDPETLAILYENSSSLRQNVDAYVTNVDAFGHRFEPVLDLDASDADQRIANAIYVERARLQETAARRGTVPKTAPESLTPTPEEVAAKRREIAALMRLEKFRVETFFKYCCADISFVTLRRQTRQDLEVLGNGYWEVLRTVDGELAQFAYVPAFSVRLLPLDREFVDVESRVHVSELTLDVVRTRRRFRRYLQTIEGLHVYFKEHGDPRILSRRYGTFFRSVEQLLENDSEDRPATELVHFKLHNPRSAYGTPRWIGNLLAVLGSRQAEEVNFLYFENKSVPPLALLVSGGRLSAQSVPRIESFIENHLKGKRNFHKILVLEAESAGHANAENAGRIRIELRPLTSAQQQDALFMKYDEANADKVGQSFRLPRLLRGDIRDFNRSCYSEDTETLTENGWKLVDDIQEGERIAAYDRVTFSTVAVVPPAPHVHNVEEELVHFSNQQVDVLVTADHRMLTRLNGKPEGPWSVCAAAEISHATFDFRAAPERHTWGEAELPAFSLPKDRRCEKEVGHTHASVDADAWLELVGYFASEGSLLKGEHHYTQPYSVRIGQMESSETCSKMLKCLDRLGWRYSVSKRRNGFVTMTLSNRCLRAWLALHCGTDCYSRKLPNEYLHLGERQLAILFSALMSGDGQIKSGPHSGVYHTTSKTLANQVQQICVHLGLRSRLRVRRTQTGRPYYYLTISDWQTASLLRKDIHRVAYRGRVYCFSVPDHGFFVTRRNGKVSIQGNTADAALTFSEMQVFQPEREEFDFVVNRKFLGELGIRFWSFRSNSPVTRDPETMATIIRNLVNANVLTPEEGRQLASDVFNRDFKKIEALWTKQPVALTLAGVPIEPDEQSELVGPELAQAAAAPQALVPPKGTRKRQRTAADSLAVEAERLVRLRDALRAAEQRKAQGSFDVRKREELETEVVRLPYAEMRSWFEPEVAHAG